MLRRIGALSIVVLFFVTNGVKPTRHCDFHIKLAVVLMIGEIKIEYYLTMFTCFLEEFQTRYQQTIIKFISNSKSFSPQIIIFIFW